MGRPPQARTGAAAIVHVLAGTLMAASLAGPAAAHSPSNAYLRLESAGDGWRGQWDIALEDVHELTRPLGGLDRDRDGRVTWGELRSRHPEIAELAFAHLQLDTGGGPCRILPDGHLVDRHGGRPYAVLRFAARCPGRGGGIRIRYGLLAGIDEGHRAFVSVRRGARVAAGVLSSNDPEIAVGAVSAPGAEQDAGGFADLVVYGLEGVRHISAGLDHLAFLLTLILPTVVRRASRGWESVERFAVAGADAVKVVTAFTLAHAATLSLAAAGVVGAPPGLVEPFIALTVLLAALNNVWPLVERRRALVAFALGLVHGLGFASALSDLGLPYDGYLMALAGFNLGVEAGQLVVVAAALPLVYALRGRRLYRPLVLQGGSLGIAAVAAVWIVERTTASFATAL